MVTLLECMKQKGFVSRNGVNRHRIASLSKGSLIDVAAEFASLTPPEDQEGQRSACAHSASISLGGGRDDCCYVGCRRTRLDHLARFAALYSDRVFVRNFFCDYEHLKARPLVELMMTLDDDISLMLHVQPLLDSGLITVVSEIDGLCFDCMAKRAGFGAQAGAKLKRARRELADEFLESLSAVVYKEEKELSVEVSGPGLYADHGQVRSIEAAPMPLRKRPRILAQLKKGQKVHLSQHLVRELKVHEDLADEVVHSVIYHAVVNRYLNASFLTNKEVEIGFLSKASGDVSLERRNALALKYLTTLVPFAGDVPIRSLDKLRRREKESLLQFRAAFNKAIDEFKARECGFSARVAEEMYSDLLAPELARLDKKVKKAKQDLVTSATRSFAGMVGAISFGLISGVIPSEFVQIAQALGVASFGSTMLQKLMALGDAEKTIQEEDFYFLWKVKNATRKKR